MNQVTRPTPFFRLASWEQHYNQLSHAVGLLSQSQHV